MATQAMEEGQATIDYKYIMKTINQNFMCVKNEKMFITMHIATWSICIGYENGQIQAREKGSFLYWHLPTESFLI